MQSELESPCTGAPNSEPAYRGTSAKLKIPSRLVAQRERGLSSRRFCAKTAALPVTTP